MASRLPIAGRLAWLYRGHAMTSSTGQMMSGEAVRWMSTAGSGEGKGGGSGGSIKSSGGSMGKRQHALEEEYFRKKQAEEVQKLQKSLNIMRVAKIEYHEKQLKRHLEQIKEHERLMKEDNDVSHRVYIKSHQTSADAHQQYLAKLKKAGDKL